MIAGNALGSRIERGFAIHYEQVMMVAVAQGNLQAPSAIDLPFHRVSLGMPIIEVAGEANGFGLRSRIDEDDGLNDALGGVGLGFEGMVIIKRIHLFERI